jgi:hypothetical protein
MRWSSDFVVAEMFHQIDSDATIPGCRMQHPNTIPNGPRTPCVRIIQSIGYKSNDSGRLGSQSSRPRCLQHQRHLPQTLFLQIQNPDHLFQSRFLPQYRPLHHIGCNRSNVRLSLSGSTLTLEHSRSVDRSSWDLPWAWMADTDPTVTSLFQQICVRCLRWRRRVQYFDDSVEIDEDGRSTNTTGLSLALETPVDKGLTSTRGNCAVVQTSFVDGGIARIRCDVRPDSRDHLLVSWIQLDGMI